MMRMVRSSVRIHHNDQSDSPLELSACFCQPSLLEPEAQNGKGTESSLVSAMENIFGMVCLVLAKDQANILFSSSLYPSLIKQKLTGDTPEVRSINRKPGYHKSALISINQHQPASSELRGDRRLKYGCFLENFQRGGSFPIQKITLQILLVSKRYILEKKSTM